MQGLNAQRFKGKPLRQPTYSFKAVPKCTKDLQGSSLQEVTSREAFNDAMAEMVLLCKEAMRRLSHDKLHGKKPSKPLSLEYIADRLDVDDPIFGYFVRTESSLTSDKGKWKQGMLQGFVTVTTFTNWQKTFRWDSMHDSSFSYDDRALAEAMSSGERRYDEDGSLAEALHSTVRCGDPWNEGIVWPRIAEVSLLGGLGCGKALLSLIIEKLECIKATGTRNYDYLVLQATDNSIPFYESMGFVRVGAITEDPDFAQKLATRSDDDASDAVPPTIAISGSESSNDGPPPQSEIVSSPVETYVTKVAGECPADIAKKLNVNVWDIIFLNQYIYKEIATRSRLMVGTSLFVPASAANTEAMDTESANEPSAPQWYIAYENDTPKSIAKKFNVACAELVNGNRERLPELQSFSRLKEGTRIKVSHFHIHDDQHVPYCHWTFPDDSFESNVPSYMMVRKLHRRNGRAATFRPVEYSLVAKVTPYSPPDSSMFVTSNMAPTAQMEPRKPPKGGRYPGEPVPPKRALSGYMIFLSEQREILKKKLAGKRANEATKVMSKLWQELPDVDRLSYQAKHEGARDVYQKAMIRYKRDLAAYQKAHPELKPAADGRVTERSNLFNKVVKLTPAGVEHAGSDHEYYFALTYIPDLQWCHLAPMRKVGTWGTDKPKSLGRPVWMLVDESEGKELDISSSFCVPVKSRAMKRTVDADREQWDILDGVDECPADLIWAIPKKKRGRPRKHPLPAGVEVNIVGGNPPPKRRPGRPRKNPIESPSPDVAIKRGPGRPRKSPLPTDASKKRGPGRPRKHPIMQAAVHQAIKRGCSQPRKRKVDQTAVGQKKDPGHPPELSIVEGSLSNAIWSTGSRKRGPGRPRKHSSPFVPSNATRPSVEGPKRRCRPHKRKLIEAIPCVSTRCNVQPPVKKRRGRPLRASIETETAGEASPLSRTVCLTRSGRKQVTEPQTSVSQLGGKRAMTNVRYEGQGTGRPTRKAAAAAAEAIHRLEHEAPLDLVDPRGRKRAMTNVRSEGQGTGRPTRKAAAAAAEAIHRLEHEAPLDLVEPRGRKKAMTNVRSEGQEAGRPTRKAAVAAAEAIHRLEHEAPLDLVEPSGRKRAMTNVRSEGQGTARPTRKAAAAAAEAIHRLEHEAPLNLVRPRGLPPTTTLRPDLEKIRKREPSFEGRVLSPNIADRGGPTRVDRPQRKAAEEANRAIRRREEGSSRSDDDDSIENATPGMRKRPRCTVKTPGSRERPIRKVAPIFGALTKTRARACRVS